MTRPHDVLLVDAGAQPLAILTSRLRRLDFRVLVAKTAEEAHGGLVDPRWDVGALLIPPDLPVADLAGALRALRRLAARRELPVLAAGLRPDPEALRRLRAAGVSEGIWEPIDAHTLRFRMNRALCARLGRQRRQVPRVPVAWGIRIARGRRAVPARLYSLSTQGAFVATERPALRGARLDLTLELPTGPLGVSGRVIATNVPGNLTRRRLPLGMAVRFDPHDVDTEARLHVAIEERARELDLPLEPR